MITYQDFLKVGDNEQERINFTKRIINEHKGSNLYKTAMIAEQYFKHKNVTILEFQKLLYTISGQAIPDNNSANYKLRSNFFYRFLTQENQFLLSNGVSWINDDTADKLGEDFDTRLQEAGIEALKGGVSFGFYNLDHIEVFSVREFAPIYDEENGALMLGVRFWQLDDKSPLRATLYELDGYTEYIWKDGEGKVLKEKQKYKQIAISTVADGTEIYDLENYDGFPIVQLWGNPMHQSELEGMREGIDCYDLIKSGFANTVDEASFIYWAIQGAGGMDDIDLTNFVDRMRRVHASYVGDGENARAEAHTLEAPYASREALLMRLRNDLYEDAMALDTKNISNGATTATQIEASYEPLNSKTDQFEYCVIQFIDGILKLAGIDDKPSFTRSRIVNTQENIQTLLQCGQYLSEDYITTKILEYLGDGDKAESMIAERDANDIGAIENEV